MQGRTRDQSEVVTHCVCAKETHPLGSEHCMCFTQKGNHSANLWLPPGREAHTPPNPIFRCCWCCAPPVCTCRVDGGGKTLSYLLPVQTPNHATSRTNKPGISTPRHLGGRCLRHTQRRAIHRRTILGIAPSLPELPPSHLQPVDPTPPTCTDSSPSSSGRIL